MKGETTMNREQLTLGELITRLENLIKKDGNDKSVCFDFEYLAPANFASWRGAYEELALGWKESSNDLSVQNLLTMCKNTVGRKFNGYKGGTYTMSKDTPIWIANQGRSGNTALIDVEDMGHVVILHTAWKEY